MDPELTDTDPLSLEAIQEAAQTFHQRRAAATARAADAPEQAVATEAGADEQPAVKTNPEPPPGAASHAGGVEGTMVKSEASPRVRPMAPSQASPGRRPRAGGADGRSPVADTSPSLAYAGASFAHRQGIDPRIRRAVTAARPRAADAASEPGHTYAFLVMDRVPTGESERALRALGAEPLGLHGGALKLRLPLDPRVLERLAALPGFRALAYAAPEQKLAPALKGVIARFGGEVNRFAVIVSLFEADARGAFAERIRATGAEVGRYDPDLQSYEVLASAEQARALAQLDFVLFVEPEKRGGRGHDQSMATNGVDYVRNAGLTGAGTVVGILDTGFMLGQAAAVRHRDLAKMGCGVNFTSDAAGVWNDQNSHGTHVLATIAGTGTANPRYRGVAPAVGAQEPVRAAKVWGSFGQGQSAWLRDGMDFLAAATQCNGPRPAVVNLSGGGRAWWGEFGTDAKSRKLDTKVWEARQLYVVCAGNSGPGTKTIWSPGIAKNALAVGNAQDFTFQAVGELSNTSSRGPSDDGRMKPNLVATGATVTSARAGTTDGYKDSNGCSMATPHVSGIAASLLQHYPDFRGRPHLLRAHLMASAVLHHDTTTPANNTSGGRGDYGLGRVSDYQAHWSRPDASGWTRHWTWMTVTDQAWGYRDVQVPVEAKRLVVVLTWDEPAASAGAARAVTYDIDLWADRGADCVPDVIGQCGEWASQSTIDNTEYLIIDNPPAGVYRLKAVNVHAPASGLPVAIAAKVMLGSPKPAMTLSAAPSTTSPALGSTFTVTTTVANPAYEAYGVHVSVPTIPSGVTLVDVATTREDGLTMNFPNARGVTLGSIVAGDTRSAVWRFQATQAGAKTIPFRAWSDNGGTKTQGVTVTP